MIKISSKGLSRALYRVVEMLENVSKEYNIPLCTYEDESYLSNAHKELKSLANILSDAIDDDICEECGSEKICPHCL